MPAKAKYLSSPRERASKVVAALLGSYVVTMLLHTALAKLVSNDTTVVVSGAYTTFLLWVGFMVLAFLVKRSWHIWALYGLLAGPCLLILFT